MSSYDPNAEAELAGLFFEPGMQEMADIIGGETDTVVGPGDTVHAELTSGNRKAVIDGTAYYALCWIQPGPGQFSTCDRVLGHEGGHSWEIGA